MMLRRAWLYWKSAVDDDLCRNHNHDSGLELNDAPVAVLIPGLREHTSETSSANEEPASYQEQQLCVNTHVVHRQNSCRTGTVVAVDQDASRCLVVWDDASERERRHGPRWILSKYLQPLYRGLQVLPTEADQVVICVHGKTCGKRARVVEFREAECLIKWFEDGSSSLISTALLHCEDLAATTTDQGVEDEYSAPLQEALWKQPTKRRKKLLALPDASTDPEALRLPLHSRVNHTHNYRTGTIIDADEKGLRYRIVWDPVPGQEAGATGSSTKWVSRQNLHPLFEGVREPPTGAGQRVRCVYGVNYGRTGNITSFTSKRCTVQFDGSAELSRGVRTADLHCEDPQAAELLPEMRLPVQQMRDWLLQYQLENSMDLVMTVKVNTGSTRRAAKNKTLEVSASGAQQEQDAAADEAAAGNTHQQEGAGGGESRDGGLNMAMPSPLKNASLRDPGKRGPNILEKTTYACSRGNPKKPNDPLNCGCTFRMSITRYRAEPDIVVIQINRPHSNHAAHPSLTIIEPSGEASAGGHVSYNGNHEVGLTAEDQRHQQETSSMELGITEHAEGNATLAHDGAMAQHYQPVGDAESNITMAMSDIMKNLQHVDRPEALDQFRHYLKDIERMLHHVSSKFSGKESALATATAPKRHKRKVSAHSDKEAAELRAGATGDQQQLLRASQAFTVDAMTTEMPTTSQPFQEEQPAHASHPGGSGAPEEPEGNMFGEVHMELPAPDDAVPMEPEPEPGGQAESVA
eukprot:jgi/Chlat1/5160/Chrsp33S05149